MSYSRLSQIKTRNERSLQLYFTTTICAFKTQFSYCPESRNPQILRPKFVSNFSLETRHPRSEETHNHQKSTVTINHGGQKRIQRGEPALRRHFALQNVWLMLRKIPDFSCSLTLLDQKITQTLWFWLQSRRYGRGLGNSGGRKRNKNIL